jgi:hypothetical protein
MQMISRKTLSGTAVVGVALSVAGGFGICYFDRGWGGSTFHVGLSDSERTLLSGSILLAACIVVAVVRWARHKLNQKDQK